MNSRLFVSGDVSMNSRLFVTSDVSLNARLFVAGDVSFNEDIYVLGKTILQGDVSMNSRLFVGNDVIVNGRLNVYEYTTTNLVYTNVTTTNYTFIVAEDMSLNGRLNVNFDTSLNQRLFVSGDVSMNGNLYNLGRTIHQGDVSMNSRLFVNGDVSMNSRLFVSSDVSLNARLFVSGDASMNGNLYTLGRTILQGDVSMNSRLCVGGDLSLNGRIFLPVGGNIYVGGTLFSGSGSSSTATTTTDVWGITNFYNAPPAVAFSTNGSTTSTTIVIPWTYPTQVLMGFNQYPLPLINSLTIQFKYWNGSAVSSFINVLTNQTGSQFVSVSASNSNGTAITALILTNNLSESTGVGSITIAGSTRYAYTFYNALTNLAASTSNSLSITYNNYNTSASTSSYNFSSFLAPGAPGQVRNLSFPTNVTSGTNSIALTIQYYPPTYSDATNVIATSSTAPIKEYLITYTTAGSSYRYGGAVPTTGSTTVAALSISTSVADSRAFTGFFPDSTYTFNIVCNNTTTNSANSTSAATTTVGTTYLTPAISLGAITYPTSLSTATLVSNTNSTPTNIYFLTTPTDWTSNDFASPIHSTTTRGIIGVTPNLTIAASHSISAGYNTSVTYGGFGLAKPGNTLTTGLAITTNTPTDSYPSGTYGSAFQGFYLQANTSVTIKAAALVPATTQYTLTVTQTQAGGTTLSTPFNYYFDTTAAISVSSFTTALHTSTTSTQICGIWVTGQTAYLTATTGVTNLGNYFFNSTQILQYNSGTNTTNEIGIGNISAASKTGGGLSASLSVSNTGAAITYTNSAYTTSIPATIVTAYNPAGASSTRASTTIPIIMDQLTLTLVNSFITVLSSTSLTTSSSYGYRIYSGVPASGNVPATNYLSANAAYTTLTAFSNAWDLTNSNIGGFNATQELLIANGAFRTRDTSYGKSYIGFQYVTGGTVNTMSGPNYTSLGSTGYRYASFAWRMQSAPSPPGCQTLNFVLTGGSLNVINSLLYADSGTNKILIYFRLESITAPGTFTSGGLNSYWISANDNTLTGASSGNYYTAPSNPTWQAGTMSYDPVSGASLGSVTVSAQLPYSLVSTNPNMPNLCLYVRIGLPMAVTGVYLSNIQVNLSA